MTRGEFHMMSDHGWEELYEEFLNEVHETVAICGYEYDAGRALRILDPIAFRCGMNDYQDSVERDLEDA
jgi:hypothetical protein